ncbi:hypothetical protein [Dongia sedimenti]|uniref:DUF5666 domain-containing protein n=1 Tax=Dongia sedimenti TaxID=3064282 RepID=A0ABU0YVS8_9PROT|nr:hypothetical protein [Rhodospirillaceae bacterium R-7]
MAIQAIGGVTSTGPAAPTGAAGPSAATQRAEAQSKDSTIVIGKVTRTNPDGSTVTTITYADGHTRIETTPPKFAATDSQGQSQAEGRVTAVDILV